MLNKKRIFAHAYLLLVGIFTSCAPLHAMDTKNNISAQKDQFSTSLWAGNKGTVELTARFGTYYVITPKGKTNLPFQKKNKNLVSLLKQLYVKVETMRLNYQKNKALQKLSCPKNMSQGILAALLPEQKVLSLHYCGGTCSKFPTYKGPKEFESMFTETSREIYKQLCHVCCYMVLAKTDNFYL